MTLPVRVQSANHHSADTQLPFTQPPAPNAAAAQRRMAVVMQDAELPLGAKVLYAALVAMGEPRWLDLHQIGAAAGMTMGQARNLVPFLERRRLVVRTSVVVTSNGRPSKRARYSLAVAA